MTPILPNLAVCILSYQLQLKTALINSGNDEDSESSIRKNKQHQSASRGHRIHPEAIKMWNSFGYQNYATDPVGRAYSASHTWWGGVAAPLQEPDPALGHTGLKGLGTSGLKLWISNLCLISFYSLSTSDVNKDWTCKDKDLTHKDQDKART